METSVKAKRPVYLKEGPERVTDKLLKKTDSQPSGTKKLEKSPAELEKEKAKETLKEEKVFILFCKLAMIYVKKALKNHPDKEAIVDRMNGLIKKQDPVRGFIELGEGVIEAYEYKNPSLKKEKVSQQMIIHGAWYDFYKFVDSINTVNVVSGDKEDFNKCKKALYEVIQPKKFKQLMDQSLRIYAKKK